MLEQLGSPAAQACWNRLVLLPPITVRGLSLVFTIPTTLDSFLCRGSLVVQIWPPSVWIPAAVSWRFGAILSLGLVGCPDLATVGLNPCRGVLEIWCHSLPSRLKGVP
ncbi:hypothetical protein SLEP1_g3384 [Rubroshorea leprosula]|uniref:Uncharacterized protein n=1 Tax=Rubroshorea leprosula TaxID=152421 RepID=A0AAV5HTY1_9ROSI|nr:hypothetical protein SLEP1_g3384 [Rubroshorea leprosula]